MSTIRNEKTLLKTVPEHLILKKVLPFSDTSMITLPSAGRRRLSTRRASGRLVAPIVTPTV